MDIFSQDMVFYKVFYKVEHEDLTPPARFQKSFLMGFPWFCSWSAKASLYLFKEALQVPSKISFKKTGCWICSSFRVQLEFTFGDFLQVLGCPRIVHWCSMDLYGSVNLSSHHLQCTAAQLGEPHTPFAGPFSCLEGSTVLGKNRFLSWCSLQISKE